MSRNVEVDDAPTIMGQNDKHEQNAHNADGVFSKDRQVLSGLARAAVERAFLASTLSVESRYYLATCARLQDFLMLDLGHLPMFKACQIVGEWSQFDTLPSFHFSAERQGVETLGLGVEKPTFTLAFSTTTSDSPKPQLDLRIFLLDVLLRSFGCFGLAFLQNFASSPNRAFA